MMSGMNGSLEVIPQHLDRVKVWPPSGLLQKVHFLFLKPVCGGYFDEAKVLNSGALGLWCKPLKHTFETVQCIICLTISASVNFIKIKHWIKKHTKYVL